MVKIKKELRLKRDPNEVFFETQSKIDSMLLEQKTEYSSGIFRVTEDLYSYTLPTQHRLGRNGTERLTMRTHFLQDEPDGYSYIVRGSTKLRESICT